MATPKEKVLAKFPNAISQKNGDANGSGYGIWAGSMTQPDQTLGFGKTASQAWQDAANNIREVKLSGRRQRIAERIQAGTFTPKTPQESKNVWNRQQQGQLPF